MSNDDNLLKFPKKFAVDPTKSSELPTVESVKETISQLKSETINEITDALNDEIIRLLSITGFDVSNDTELFFETCLLVETVRALVSKKFEHPHPFHEFCQNVFEVKEDGVIFFNSPKFKFGEAEEVVTESLV